MAVNFVSASSRSSSMLDHPSGVDSLSTSGQFTLWKLPPWRSRCFHRALFDGESAVTSAAAAAEVSPRIPVLLAVDIDRA